MSSSNFLAPRLCCKDHFFFSMQMSPVPLPLFTTSHFSPTQEPQILHLTGNLADLGLWQGRSLHRSAIFAHQCDRNCQHQYHYWEHYCSNWNLHNKRPSPYFSAFFSLGYSFGIYNIRRPRIGKFTVYHMLVMPFHLFMANLNGWLRMFILHLPFKILARRNVPIHLDKMKIYNKYLPLTVNLWRP